MDKEKILQVLEQGASFWNGWRKQQAKWFLWISTRRGV